MVVTNPYKRTSPGAIRGTSSDSAWPGCPVNNGAHAAGVPGQPWAARAQPMEVGTPTKPKRSNPYAKSPNTPVRNPYAKEQRSTNTTPVRNPYAKSPTSMAVTPASPPAKRPHVDDEGVASCKRKISFNTSDVGQMKNVANTSTAGVSLGGKLGDLPKVDSDKTYWLFFDGGSRGNPGVAGAGMVLYDGECEIWSGRQYLGDNKTNNEAEYVGLVAGLDCALRLGVQRIIVKGDSKLVVKQVLGEWQCNKPHLRVWLQRAIDAREQFLAFDIRHVYRQDNKRADALANMAMDRKCTDLGVLAVLQTPPLSQESIHDAMEGTAKETDAIEEICVLTFSQSISDAELSAVDDGDWTGKLPFLVQYELERLNLRKDLRSSEFGARFKAAFDEHEGKPSLREELVSLIYQEDKTLTTQAPYLDLLKLNGAAIDESTSCILLFQAKLCETGIELRPPQIASVETRRVHRKFGSHRFLDLYIESKCAESLPVLKKHLKKHLVNNKLFLGGRTYGILYSNPSGKQVTFRLFAESGVGIENCDDISAPEVAACCIPPDLNNNISLTKYMKRMKLSFTSTIPTLILEMGMLEGIDDITAVGTGNVMTDGCGLISREALNKVYTEYLLNREQRNCELGNASNASHGGTSLCPYSSFQGRIGPIKGMFVVDDRLDGVKVMYRESQKKYGVPLTEGRTSDGTQRGQCIRSDDVLQNTVEIKEWDTPPPSAFLSQNAIQLLEARGVPKEYFLDLATKEIEELTRLRTDHGLLMQKYKARMFLRDSKCLFDDDVFHCMLLADVSLDEPYLMKKTNDFINGELKSFREKSRFPECASRYLRMLPDHTGLLEHDEAFAVVGDGAAQAEMDAVGSIVAMRMPSYFFSDLRKLKAIGKVDIIRRCREKGLDPSISDFFCGITCGLLLSTKGPISQAEMMSGGDFDGDKAWVCWNKLVVNCVQECPEQNLALCKQPEDPFKKRTMQWSDPDWSNLIISYTMQHRNDKRWLGSLVKTLESMRDNPRFNSDETDEIARRAFIQVDNPHTSQWNTSIKEKYGSILRPHWQASGKAGNTYQSKTVLGCLFGLLNEVGAKPFNLDDIEDNMNQYIREKVEKAFTKNPAEVESIRRDMRKRLTSFNCEMKDRISLYDADEEIGGSNFDSTKRLRQQYRADIENSYDEDDLLKVFAILYEQTYFESRERMHRWNKQPYIFAWEVGHDYLTRIIADGKAKELGGGLAPTIARGKERNSFGRGRR